MSNIAIEDLKNKIASLPEEPGVYRFLDNEDNVIYVGKAKNLKKRVGSYFVTWALHRRKVVALVKNIHDIKYVVVDSENDALLLENSMIKTLQPKYNILLKDDKTYPWIVIKNEEYPRILQTRHILKDGSTYFGPYSSITMQKSILDLVLKLYRIRTCSLNLTQKSIDNSKFGICLEYHIKNCKAPCVGYQSKERYIKSVEMAHNVLKGNLKEAKEYLTSEMNNAAERLQFEEALALKDRLQMLSNYESRSVIVSTTFRSLDVFFLIKEENIAYCNYTHIKDGAIINSYTVEMRLSIEETKEEILSFAIMQIYSTLERKPAHEVIVPFLPDSAEGFNNFIFTIPQRGDKLKLLEFSKRNCKMFIIEKSKYIENINPEKQTNRLMSKMKSDLMLTKEPRHIECFDNSNIQGAYPVSSCVVFKNGKPAKRSYRHFNIKTVKGIDDFASMKEVLTRRYTKIIEQEDSLPDLIVIDGGKGQLSSAYEVLKELNLEHKIEIIGLAKRFEEVFYPLDPTPHYLDKTSETLKVLMHIRDEAHRFCITFHRNKRSKGVIKSELDDIKGVGVKSIEALLKAFGTISKIKEASFEDVQNIIGKPRAKILLNSFKPMKKLIFATNNKNKLKEVSQMLDNRYELSTPIDFGITEDIPETSNTLEGNAAQKSSYIYERVGVDCFADDTGLEVEVLDGAPGVYSARYAGEQNDSNNNMDLLLKNLEGKENRRARFRTVISLIIDGKEYQFEGIVNGVIASCRMGNEGFGYDPIFIANGYTKSFAQIDSAEKNKISHRGLAIKQLISFLKNYSKETL